MRDVLRQSLGRSLEHLNPLDRLIAAWPVAAGKSIAAHGTITALTGTVAHIHVEDPAWLTQMLSMRTALQHDLARIAAVPLTAIHFESAPPRKRPETKAP